MNLHKNKTLINWNAWRELYLTDFLFSDVMCNKQWWTGLFLICCWMLEYFGLLRSSYIFSNISQPTTHCRQADLAGSRTSCPKPPTGHENAHWNSHQEHLGFSILPKDASMCSRSQRSNHRPSNQWTSQSRLKRFPPPRRRQRSELLWRRRGFCQIRKLFRTHHSSSLNSTLESSGHVHTASYSTGSVSKAECRASFCWHGEVGYIV